MLQSIQYIGSGPPTYVYSENAASASNMFFRVFAPETSGYRSQQEKKEEKDNKIRRKEESEPKEEELRVPETRHSENLQEVYQKEYGRRESFLWKQK